MPPIRELPPALVAQIAAGEVIERPSSVVKELLENSLDAGATRIDIDLEAAGTELIRVADDGCGIPADELRLALLTHATSKLTCVDDLFRVATMGFRGEALASIGSIATVTIQSRPPGQAVGAEIRADAGVLSEPRPWGGPAGTRVEVRHLFRSVPVRKKFLKSLPTELGHICETVTRLALANPKLHITLRHNNKPVTEVPARAGLPDRIALFFGDDVRAALLELEPPPGPYQLNGYVADPVCDRGTAKCQYLFVNGRWVRDRNVAHALQEAYRNLLMVGRHAVGFLFLKVPTDQVDVNVHPTKSEVKFRDNSIIHSLVRSTVKARLLRANLVPTLAAPPRPGEPDAPPEPLPAAWELRAPPTVNRGELFTNVSPPESPRREEALATPDPWAPPAPFALPEQLPAGSALQVHDSYLVLETPAGMMVIDQHALHERILFEQFRERIRAGRLEIQRLLVPEPIDLTPAQAAAVMDAQIELAELGLEVAAFGGSTILLSSYPTLLKRRDPGEIFAAVVDHLTREERPPSKEAFLDHLLATMACKAAVKAGDRLTAEEIVYLLKLRDLAEDSSHCPHGRPTQLMFSRHELDRQFRRI